MRQEKILPHFLIRLFVHFGKTRDRSQQGKDTRQNRGGSDHQLVHLADNRGRSDGCNSGLRHCFECTNSRCFQPFYMIAFH